jgi:WD40 repeat protein
VVTTLAQIPIDIQQALPLRISPNHRFLLVAQVYSATKEDFQIWDINSGKKISTIVPQNNKTGGLYQWTFSPDGSQVAANTTDDKLQIFATASGKLLASFSNNTRGGNTSWSPDGKYIAESTDAIQIFDAHAKKLVATFGKVDDQHEIMGLTWAPDSTGLASVTAPQANNAPPYCTVNVWRLS